MAVQVVIDPSAVRVWGEVHLMSHMCECATTTVVSDVVEAMLGPTGNLRAPTLRVGKTVVVGFNEDVYSDVLL